MKLKMTEYGIILEPETDWERRCLEKIANKTLTAKFEDGWENKGAMKIEFEPHPWDR
jgi:hypothetical protein